MKIQWYFLLGFLFVSVVQVSAQQETNEPSEKDTLNLIFREMDARDFNGSAYTISGEQIRNLPVTSLTNVLAGLVPGFFSRQSEGGMANENASYWIRGLRTTSEGVLVLVDGQEREFGILTPHEVESITILKDAAAVVLYGMRAANGALLINTRKGAKGKPSIELTTQLINQKPISLLRPLSALEYAQQYNEALRNDGLDESNMYSQYYLSQYRTGTGVNEELYPDVDWMDNYFKESSWVQRYNLNISGGTDRTRYFVNAGMISQSGMFETDEEFSYSTNNEIDRYNVRSNVEFDVTPSTMLSLELYGWYDKQNRPGGDSFGAYNALATTPANSFPAFYLDHGNYVDQSGNAITSVNNKIVAGNGITTNPWVLINRNGYSILERIYGSFRGKLTQDLGALTRGLSASFILSMDSQAQAVANRTKGFAYYQLIDPNDPFVLRKTNTDEKMVNNVTNKNSNRKTSLDMQLSYNRLFGRHGISALAFYNQYEFANEVSIPSRFQGIGSWVGYNYGQRYGVDFLMSYQGAYKFAPGNQFGFFPTVAAGWTVSNEPFFKNIEEFIPYLKFRGSYGLLGSHRGVAEFRWMGRLSPTSGIYYFGNAMANAQGFVEDIIANPGLTWEKSEQINVGVDTRLFRNKLSLTAEYFRDNRTDIYVNNNRISSLLGTEATVEENIGEMYTDVYEFVAMWNANIGEMAYSVGGTFSHSKNMIVKMGEVDQPYEWLQSAGYPRGVKRGYVAQGFFESYEEIAAAPVHTFSDVHPGDIRYQDINGDGIIDSNDQVPLGYNDVPDIFYGINLGFSYKGIGLSALFQGAAQVSRTMAGRVAFPFLSNGNIYEHQMDYWTPENPSAALPNLSTIHTGGVNNSQSSSFWIRNADYLRLNTLELYYNLPDRLFKEGFVKNIRLFVSGYNLYTWTIYDSPLDPEDDGNAASMPITRNVSVGCSIKF